MKKLAVIPLVFVLMLALSGTAMAGTLSNKDALKVALGNCGLAKSQVKSIEYDRDKDTVEVSFKKKSNGGEYEYEISKKTSKILEKEVKYPYKHCCCKAKIGKKAALKKAAKASGVKLSIVKKGTCTYRYKGHVGKYTVKFKYKGVKHEYVILGYNGKVVKKQKNWQAVRS